MLKRLLFILAMLLVPLSVSANIVNNSGSTAADSISIPFFALDSLGKPVGLVTNDSVYLAVFYPNGSLAFRDTLVYNASAIDTVKFAGEIYYNWNLAVADIDGSGKNGVYSYIIITIDNTLALTTPHRGHFQLYQTLDYNAGIDSILAAIARLDDVQVATDSIATAIATANKGNFKSTGFSTHSASDVWSVVTRSLTDKANFTLSGAGIDAFWDEPQSGHTSAGTFGFYLDAQVSTVGGGSLTEAGIADAVWDELQSGHTTIGTFGKYLDTEVSGIAAGSGPTVSEIYAEFVSGSNEDVFKAVGFSTHSASDIWSVVTRTLTVANWSTHSVADIYSYFISGSNEDAFKAAGFSTFDGNLNLDNATGTLSDAQVDNITVTAGTVSDKTDYTLSSSGINSILDTDTTGHTTGGTVGGAMVSGGVAIVDSTSVANAVLNAPQANHTTIGTIGSYIDAKISGIAGLSGSGAYTYNWALIDSTSGADTVLPQAKMVVNNVDQSASPFEVYTGNTGIATFNLDAGAWVAFTTYPGMVAVVDTFTVSGATTDTLYVYTDSTNFTTVAFDLRSIIGASGISYAQVKIRLESVNNQLLYVGTELFSEREIPLLTANSSGEINVKLYPNDTFTTDSTYYMAYIYDDKGRRKEKFKFRVPDGTLVYIQNCVRW